jgi:hypothetical protein
MMRSAIGWTASFGSEPALATSKRARPRFRRMASAIWLPAELCVQRKRTLNRSWPSVIEFVTRVRAHENQTVVTREPAVER